MGKKTDLHLEELFQLAQEENLISAPAPHETGTSHEPDKEMLASFSTDALNQVASYASKFEIRDQTMLYELFHLIRNGLIKGYMTGQDHRPERRH